MDDDVEDDDDDGPPPPEVELWAGDSAAAPCGEGETGDEEKRERLVHITPSLPRRTKSDVSKPSDGPARPSAPGPTP